MEADIIDLATCRFVAAHNNVLLVGPSGVGKSHIAQALGQRACRVGYKVLYITARDLLKQLRAARRDDSYERRLNRFVGSELLLLDDLGLHALTTEETLDLCDVIRLRYQKGSSIVTSNRSIEELPSIFGDPLLASAAMDRLLEDTTIIVVEDDSYRNPHPRNARPSPNEGRNKLYELQILHCQHPPARSLWPPRHPQWDSPDRNHLTRRLYRVTMAAPDAITLAAP